MQSLQQPLETSLACATVAKCKQQAAVEPDTIRNGSNSQLLSPQTALQAGQSHRWALQVQGSRRPLPAWSSSSILFPHSCLNQLLV